MTHPKCADCGSNRMRNIDLKGWQCELCGWREPPGYHLPDEHEKEPGDGANRDEQ